MTQGTIKDFDEETRAGVLLMDDHGEVRIDATSLEGSDIRMLRLGQRVKFDLAEEAGSKVARSLKIVTFE
jgi:2-phospho-L-lactate/phosphoenolpyruvate guanylyltransferase